MNSDDLEWLAKHVVHSNALVCLARGDLDAAVDDASGHHGYIGTGRYNVTGNRCDYETPDGVVGQTTVRRLVEHAQSYGTPETSRALIQADKERIETWCALRDATRNDIKYDEDPEKEALRDADTAARRALDAAVAGWWAAGVAQPDLFA